MKVSIITEGFANTGYGHLTRCQSLYQAFQVNNITPQLIARCDKGGAELLEGIQTLVFNWHEQEIELLHVISGSDIAIVDSYYADYELLDKIRKSSKKTMYIDDYIRLDYPDGIVVNGAVRAEELPYPKNGCSYLLGAKYAMLRKEFWDVPEKRIAHEIKEILITMGGKDVRNLTPSILASIVENYPDAKKNVIIGKGFDNIREIEKVSDSTTTLNYFPDSNGMLKAMMAADIAVSAAGQTLNELARVGVPTVAVGVADNQINNINGFLSIGFLGSKILYDEDNVLGKILVNVIYFENKKLRETHVNAGKIVIDGRSNNRIINYLLNNTLI